MTTDVCAGAVWPRRADVRDAVAPLWHDGTLGMLQLTVDQVFAGELPEAFVSVLDEASAAGRLVGHGVMASPYTSPRDAVARGWIRRARAAVERWPVRWLTDHVGCARVGDWQAAPLPLPASRRLVSLVRDHLAWLADELQVPVGLENLALAASQADVLHQPDLVDAMLEPDGVLLLDLHNLWCGAHNQGLDPVALLERWPLHRVKQLHIAGGSWDGDLRRDTHDGPVPDEVWQLLPDALARCPNLEVVVWERLRGTVEAVAPLQAELRRLRAVVDEPGPVRAARGLPQAPPWPELDPVAVQQALYAAARADDRSQLEAVAPGWWVDERSWRAAVDVTQQWGRPVPVARP